MTTRDEWWDAATAYVDGGGYDSDDLWDLVDQADGMLRRLERELCDARELIATTRRRCKLAGMEQLVQSPAERERTGKMLLADMGAKNG